MPGSMSGTCSTPCVPYKLAQREEALVALDWDFDDELPGDLGAAFGQLARAGHAAGVEDGAQE